MAAHIRRKNIDTDMTQPNAAIVAEALTEERLRELLTDREITPAAIVARLGRIDADHHAVAHAVAAAHAAAAMAILRTQYWPALERRIAAAPKTHLRSPTAFLTYFRCIGDRDADAMYQYLTRIAAAAAVMRSLDARVEDTIQYEECTY